MTEDLTNKIAEIIPKIMNTNKLANLQRIDHDTVNVLYTFTVKSKNYILKILTRAPRVEHEYFRFEKEASIMKQFNKMNSTEGTSEQERIRVPTPEIVLIESNEDVLGHKFIIMTKVQGIPLEDIWEKLAQKRKIKIVKKLATIVKDIHSVTFDMFGEIEEYDCPRRYYSMKSLLQALIRKSARQLGKSNLLPIKLITQVQQFVEKNLDKTNYCEIPKLVHSDLNLSNIIVDIENKDEITAILDYEWSHAGDPLKDLFELEDHLLKDLELRKCFYTIYFDNERDNLDDYSLERKIQEAVSCFNTVEVGWAHFHPTQENLTWIKGVLERILENQ